MFGYSGNKMLHDAFANQFEPDGDYFVYRKNMKGAPIKVSAAERDRFIRAYDRFLKRSWWVIVGYTLVLIFALATYAVENGEDLSPVAIYVGIGFLFVLYMAVLFWAKDKPARELRDRTPIGGSRSRAEMRALFFSKLTYRQLIVSVGGVALALVMMSRNENLLAGWNRLWLVFAAGIVVSAVWQAFRKWQFDLANKK